MRKYHTSGERFVVVDVETTGLSPRRRDRVIEIGAVAIEDGSFAAEFQTLIQVPRDIPWQATLIHGITDEMLAGQPAPEDVFPALKEFIGESILIAHNAPFDLAFLRYEFDLLGFPLNNRSICTLKLARRRLPHLSNHRLETVARHVLGGLPHGGRLHRALDDARLTAQIWLALAGCP
jgi:DNA polymerase III subunit epsilon